MRIIDDNEVGYSRFSDSMADYNKCLHVYNPNCDEIILLPVDNKFITNHCGGIADCAVFNTEIFCFAEFKANALGNSQKAIEETYTTAMKQLKETLRLFLEKLKSIKKDLMQCTEVICHIIVSSQFPRSRATEQTCQLVFAKETGVELSFENLLSFG